MCADYDTLVGRVLSLIDFWENGGPVYGPVDGTGRYDPDGHMMVDFPLEGLLDQLRELLGLSQYGPKES